MTKQFITKQRKEKNMQIMAELKKPFTDVERLNFIVEQNHKKGFIIEEVENALLAWGLTDEEKEQKKKERIAKLSLTKREVFLALFHDKGITPEMLKAQITNPEALIEFEYANDYFRGNPLIEQIGATLGYTPAQLDYLFINGEFEKENVN